MSILTSLFRKVERRLDDPHEAALRQLATTNTVKLLRKNPAALDKLAASLGVTLVDDESQLDPEDAENPERWDEFSHTC